MVFVLKGNDGYGEGSLCLGLRCKEKKVKDLTGLFTLWYITSVGGGVNAVSTV